MHHHIVTCFFLLAIPLLATPPKNTLPLDAKEWPTDYRLHLEGSAKVTFSSDFHLDFEDQGPHDLAVESSGGKGPILRIWNQGKLVRGPEVTESLSPTPAADFPDSTINFGEDFTVLVRFQTTGDGTVFSKCEPTGKWTPDAKALLVRQGKLVFDIAWLGEISSTQKVNDGAPHTVVVQLDEGNFTMQLDGNVIAEKKSFRRADRKSHVLKVGRAATDFGGAFSKGKIADLRIWKRALPQAEIVNLWQKDSAGANTPDFSYQPKSLLRPQIEATSGWIQALERSDHASIISSWNKKSLKEGAEIYKTNCIICHGTKDQPGSLPTALRFAEGAFKNGADPHSMYLTLTKGYGQMVAQPQYTTAQKYAVIHYIRETFLKPHNASQYTPISAELLTALPKGLAQGKAEKIDRSLPPYKLMESGPALLWTYQIEKDNIAKKGIAIRVDEGKGGVTKGRAWMIYDHDTMRLAAATTGDFVDWRGIAFDGSHGTHTSLTGDKHLVLPESPGWTMNDFEDKRKPAKDGKKYGPHPLIQYKGIYFHQNQCVIEANIYGANVLESPSWIDNGDQPVFVRTLHGRTPWQALKLRVAPANLNVVMKGEGNQGVGTLIKENGFWVANFISGDKVRFFISRAAPDALENVAKSVTAPIDLIALTHGAPMAPLATFTTQSVAGKGDTAFLADEFPLPVENHYKSWLRPGGFDFTPDGAGAIVAMWNGDVWHVDGIKEKAPATLTWRRIASGLFQPLGVKFRGDELFITCRDQIAKLVDHNDDGVIDQIACFNNDAQVTEHFHEFAMGLQIDDAGNFYYAKSARHALDSVVPHHGTLLKVSADGCKTEIVATGFRAANGVCLNADGSFFVTDQEGHWTPKNRINHVSPGGFYGNMYGYTNVKDSADSAMQQPMVWMTNTKDRSPAELLWIPKTAWGNLGGSLLNLSYGTGRAFIIPHETIGQIRQGAVCELPMPELATGIMRGRFGMDGELYTCGMFAWAGNAITPGGFYRIRRSSMPAQVPVAIHATTGQLQVTFSDPIIDTTCKMSAWSLKRTANYGSKHFNEKEWKINNVSLSPDQCSLILDIPELRPTDCYELTIGKRKIHGTIHVISVK